MPAPKPVSIAARAQRSLAARQLRRSMHESRTKKHEVSQQLRAASLPPESAATLPPASVETEEKKDAG